MIKCPTQNVLRMHHSSNVLLLFFARCVSTDDTCADADAPPHIALDTYLQKLWLPSPRMLASIFLAVNFRPLRDVEFQLMHSAPEWLILHVPRYPSPLPTTHFSLVSVGKRDKAKLNVVSLIYIWDWYPSNNWPNSFIVFIGFGKT